MPDLDNGCCSIHGQPAFPTCPWCRVAELEAIINDPTPALACRLRLRSQDQRVLYLESALQAIADKDHEDLDADTYAYIVLNP